MNCDSAVEKKDASMWLWEKRSTKMNWKWVVSLRHLPNSLSSKLLWSQKCLLLIFDSCLSARTLLVLALFLHTSIRRVVDTVISLGFVSCRFGFCACFRRWIVEWGKTDWRASTVNKEEPTGEPQLWSVHLNMRRFTENRRSCAKQITMLLVQKPNFAYCSPFRIKFDSFLQTKYSFFFSPRHGI